MTKSQEQKIREAAERYATGNYRSSFPDTFEMRAFDHGAQFGIALVREEGDICPACGTEFEQGCFKSCGGKIMEEVKELRIMKKRVERFEAALRDIGFTEEGFKIVGISNKKAIAGYERVVRIAQRALQESQKESAE